MIKPSAPKLRALPKIHKPNIPIRPLVNFRNAPTYKLAKFLERTIKQNIKLNPDYSIRNNQDLISKIDKVNI